jgi:hypothetical protein
MATTAAPYGLKPVKRADGMPYAGLGQRPSISSILQVKRQTYSTGKL